MSDVTIDDIRRASVRIHPFIYRTPFLIKTNLTKQSGFEKLFFKCEALQRTGTFKLRGAVNFVMGADERRPADQKGKPMQFIATTSGNWGLAVARAAKFADHSAAHIVVPRSAPKNKINAMKHVGANVTLSEFAHEKRDEIGSKLLAAIPGSMFIDQWADPHVIAGFGTLGLEIADQYSSVISKVPEGSYGSAPDVVILPLGGAALLAGAAIAVRAACPNALIVGCEPASVGVAVRSFASGKLEVTPQKEEGAIPDGLRTHLTERSLSMIKHNVDDIVAVTDAEIKRAMLLILLRLKIVVEPSAALAAAVALFHRSKLAARHPDRNFRTAVVVLSEGNVDVDHMSDFVSKI